MCGKLSFWPCAEQKQNIKSEKYIVNHIESFFFFLLLLLLLLLLYSGQQYILYYFAKNKYGCMYVWLWLSDNRLSLSRSWYAMPNKIYIMINGANGFE
jgi:hypothetical protein